MKRNSKKVAIEKVLVGLQRAKMGEFRQNELVRDYLSMRLAILELN